MVGWLLCSHIVIRPFSEVYCAAIEHAATNRHDGGHATPPLRSRGLWHEPPTNQQDASHLEPQPQSGGWPVDSYAFGVRPTVAGDGAITHLCVCGWPPRTRIPEVLLFEDMGETIGAQAAPLPEMDVEQRHPSMD